MPKLFSFKGYLNSHKLLETVRCIIGRKREITMSRQPSEKTKAKQHRGEGNGADYIPYIFINEVNSSGTASNPVDWKHGRALHLLSQAETWWYYALRWDDNVIDIREQFPLDLESTLRIADHYSIRHPYNREKHMTTDFLVTYSDQSLCAYSVKTGRTIKDNDRTIEKLFLEAKYWEEKGVPWKLLYKEDMSRQFYLNISSVVMYYNINNVHDKASLVKHLIATKQLEVDMYKKIDYSSLVNQLDNTILKGGLIDGQF